MVNKNYDSEFIEVVIALEDKCGRIHGTGNTPEEARYSTLKSLLDRDRNMAYRGDFFGLAKGREKDIPKLREDLDWFEGLIEEETIGKKEGEKPKFKVLSILPGLFKASSKLHK